MISPLFSQVIHSSSLRVTKKRKSLEKIGVSYRVPKQTKRQSNITHYKTLIEKKKIEVVPIKIERGSLNIRKSINNNECCYYDILNHKKNGDVFWNRLALFPVGATPDTYTYYVGIQMEISASSERISKFNDEIKKNQIAKKVKNPFQEIMNAQRASDLVFFNPSEITYEEFVGKIKNSVQDICEFIRSL